MTFRMTERGLRPTQYAKKTYLQKVALTNKKLRTGDISAIAESTMYSNTHVSDVLSGKEFNTRIVNFAYNKTRNRMSNTKKLSQLA